MAALTAVLTISMVGLGGCGRTDTARERRLTGALRELTSVGVPPGVTTARSRYATCHDGAEMPMASADFHAPTRFGRGIDADNAAYARLERWYERRWRRLGWQVGPNVGEAQKVIDGVRVRAGVDAGPVDGFSIIVVQDADGLCDLRGHG